MLPSKIEKPWGYEIILEKNDFYVVKKLFMKKDCMCSLQFHEMKHETIYVLSGTLKIFMDDKNEGMQELTLHEGDVRAIPPRTIHRMAGETDALYLEASTPQLDDVVRITDLYGRE
jgi:mannose-6-phosphate isomerase